MKELRGKVVLITGAAHGIGMETARAFAREGSRVVLTDIHEERLAGAVAELAEDGHQVYGIQVDLRDKEDIYSMIDKTQRDVGGIDVLVNNAGVVYTRLMEDMSEKEITDTVEVNLYAPIWTVRRALPGMIARRSGHIVNVASVAGKATNPYMAVYCATKFGVIGFTDTLNQELHYHNIQTTVVNPGWVNSGMFKGARRIPLARWQHPSVIANAILYAVKNNKSEVHRPRLMWFGGILRALLGPKLMARAWRLFRSDNLFKKVEGYQ